MSRVNLIGNRYGYYTVIGQAETRHKGTKNSVCYWVCRCDCGNIREVSTSNLTKGHSKSCGCYNRKRAVETNTSHGLSKTRLYHEWNHMKYRCFNPKSKAYNNYGGRGIKVCDEWRHDFEAFYKWSMENGYRDDLTIDRIDVNKGYSPENCRWADATTQARNTRKNVFLTYKGERRTVSEWAEITGIKVATLYARHHSGWNDEKTIETPVGNDRWHPYIN